MHRKGLVRVMEECGELIQAAAKLDARLELNIDRAKYVANLQREVGDVLAAIALVSSELSLDAEAIAIRRDGKMKKWTDRGW
jgi:NTP pyrophosphatase (non-canonical NTP hydrolase)